MLTTRQSFRLPDEIKSTGVARIDAWDGWRGIAIFLVLCGHFYDFKWIWEDRMGVDVFFVLSGMLMSTILFDKRLSLKDFYIRRLSRVFPVLFAYVFAIYTFSWVQSLSFTASEVFSSLVFCVLITPRNPVFGQVRLQLGTCGH